MKTLIEKLDPDGFGRISFDGFCKGIHEFLGELKYNTTSKVVKRVLITVSILRYVLLAMSCSSHSDENQLYSRFGRPSKSFFVIGTSFYSRG